MHQRIGWHGIAVSLVILAACSEGLSGPGGRDSPWIRPQFSVSSITGRNWSWFISPSNSNTSVGPIPIDSFPWDAVFHVVATGSIGSTYNYGPEIGQAGPTWDAGGEFSNNNCSANISLPFSIAGFGYCFYPGYTHVLDTVFIGRGAGAVMWVHGPNDAHYPECGPGSTPCYDIAGNIQVTLEKIAAQVSLTPDPVTSNVGSQLSFAVSISPSSYRSLQLPIQVIDYWRFQPDTGSQQTVCVPGLTCQMTASTSGTLSTIVIAQGDSLRMSARLTVNPCPPSGDTDVDNPELRKQLFDELAASHQQGIPWNERGGWFYDGPAGELLHDITTLPGPTNTDCHSDISSPTLPYPPKSQWHIHPIGIGDVYVNCLKVPPLTHKTVEDPFSISADATRYQQVLVDYPNMVFWILSQGGVLYRLDPTHTTWQTVRRWNFNQNDPSHCMTAIP